MMHGPLNVIFECQMQFYILDDYFQWQNGSDTVVIVSCLYRPEDHHTSGHNK